MKSDKEKLLELILDKYLSPIHKHGVSIWTSECIDPNLEAYSIDTRSSNIEGDMIHSLIGHKFKIDLIYVQHNTQLDIDVIIIYCSTKLVD